MYLEFLKNSLLLDSSELMAVRLISASWAQKRLILTFYQWCASSSWKIFFSSIRASWWLLDSFRPPEHKNVWFQVFTHVLSRVHEKFSSRRFERWLLDSPKMTSNDVRRVHEKFSSRRFERLIISASWAQKRLIPSFYTCSGSSSWKVFFSPIRGNRWLLDSFRPPETKNVWFLISSNDVRRVHEKFYSRRFERADGC